MTHINAFFMEAEEAKSKLELAQVEYDEAMKRLEAKKAEVGFEEPILEEVTEEVTIEEIEVKKPKLAKNRKKN